MHKRKRVELAMTITAADAAARTIEGTIVPYGEIGVATVDGEAREIRYRPGSVELGRDRVPLVFSHDLDRPIGVLQSLAETADAATAKFAIDRTPDGDSALAQAMSGSRSGLSVGAELTDWEESAGGVIDVASSQVFHVGLVTVPAFASAEVASVTAAKSSNRKEAGMDPKELRESLGLAEDATDEQVNEALAEAKAARESAGNSGDEQGAGDDAQTSLETTQEKPVQHGKPVVLAERRPEIKAGDAGRFVQAMMRAANGDTAARKLVQAALSVIDSGDVPGLMPKQYVGSILGDVTTERALAERVAVKRPMPDSGMEFTKPKWDTLPNGGWVAENAATPSNAPAIGTQDVTILEWAYGVAMSYAVATRSNPDAIEAIYRAAVEDYYADCEQKIADLLLASDTPTGAGATMGAGIAAYYAGVTRRAPKPNRLVVAPDVYGDLFDALVMVPVVQGASGVGADFTGTIGGLEVVVSPFLPDGTEIITSQGVVEFRETTPIRLTSNVIGALQVELGVTSFASFDLERPGGIITLTPAAGAPAGTSSAKRSAAKGRK